MGITKTELFTEEQNRLANLAKSLAHPARIAIIQHLLATNTCINGDLVDELGLAQATISKHLSELKQAGILKGNISGTRLNYCIDPKGWEEISTHFTSLFNQFPKTAENCC
jgi:predicted transcriptional regulator